MMDSMEKSPVESWMGWSRGHWRVKRWWSTSDFNEIPGSIAPAISTAKLTCGRAHTPRARITQYEATIEDPKVFTRPWKISMPLYRRMDKNVQIMEFKCVEFAEPLMYKTLRKPATK